MKGLTVIQALFVISILVLCILTVSVSFTPQTMKKINISILSLFIMETIIIFVDKYLSSSDATKQINMLNKKVEEKKAYQDIYVPKTSETELQKKEVVRLKGELENAKKIILKRFPKIKNDLNSYMKKFEETYISNTSPVPARDSPEIQEFKELLMKQHQGLTNGSLEDLDVYLEKYARYKKDVHKYLKKYYTSDMI